MRISTSFSAFVFKNDESDYLLYQFVPTHYRVHSVKLSKKMNNYIITALNLYQFVQVAAMYKQKTNKIQLINSFKSNEKAPKSDFN